MKELFLCTNPGYMVILYLMQSYNKNTVCSVHKTYNCKVWLCAIKTIKVILISCPPFCFPAHVPRIIKIVLVFSYNNLKWAWHRSWLHCARIGWWKWMLPSLHHFGGEKRKVVKWHRFCCFRRFKDNMGSACWRFHLEFSNSTGNQ